MKRLWIFALGACATALSGCGGTQSCTTGLMETGVGFTYSGFASGSKLTTQVCIKSVCHVSAPTKGDSKEWVSVGIDPSALKGVQVISVTVRDATKQVVARNDAVGVHELSVSKGCTTTDYDAALRISPDHIAAATRT